MSDSTTKRCSTCKFPFPRTTEHFYRNKKNPDGLNNVCKRCSDARAKAWKEANPERHRQNKTAWTERNHEKILKRAREYYYENHAVKLAYAKQYRETNRLVLREKTKRYFAENPHVMKRNNRRRKSRTRNLPHTFTEAQEREMLEYWDYKCAVCGKPAGMWTKLVPDHWIAIADPRPDNPGTVATNMIPLCNSKPGIPAGVSCCNDNKKNKPAYEWLVERFGKHKADQVMKRVQAYFEWVKLTS